MFDCRSELSANIRSSVEKFKLSFLNRGRQVAPDHLILRGVEFFEGQYLHYDATRLSKIANLAFAVDLISRG
jgi:hypothetical protein